MGIEFKYILRGELVTIEVIKYTPFKYLGKNVATIYESIEFDIWSGDHIVMTDHNVTHKEYKQIMDRFKSYLWIENNYQEGYKL